MIDTKLEMLKTLEIFKSDELIEVRAVGKKTKSGYFMSREKAVEEVLKYPKETWYFVLNQIRDDCHARPQRDCIHENPKSCTADHDITYRNWILIDADPIRTSDTSASDDEKRTALMTMAKIHDYLEDVGFASPVVCDSGNGYHLLYKIQLENKNENTELIKQFIEVLNMLFGDVNATGGGVSIDTSVFNASRITKLYGSWARKGSNTPDRPHRQSRIMRVPDEIKPTSKLLIQKVADILPKPEKPTYRNNYTAFDLRGFIAQHGIGIAKETNSKDITKFVLDECVFNPNHKTPDAAFFELSNGAIAYKCLHASCSDYRWQDVRQKFDPNCYERTEAPQHRDNKPLPPVNVPTSEQAKNKDDGYHFIRVADIKAKDRSKIVVVKTGLDPIDEKIGGANLGEVTVWSGGNGSGKEQPTDILIPTPDGMRRFGDLAINDYVFDETGKPTKVMGVFPQGKKECYKIIFSDGRTALCGLNHLWQIRTEKGHEHVLTTGELINNGLYRKHGKDRHASAKYSIVRNGAAQYPTKEYKVNPYVMGYILGNGCLRQRQLTISSNDEECIAEIARLIGSPKYSRNSIHNYNWSFELPNEYVKCRKNNTKFITKEVLSECQLLVNAMSGDKFIPEEYLTGDVEQRYSLLQGLFDSDGSITSRGSITYSTVSKKLANDIQILCYSLGISAVISRVERKREDLRLRVMYDICIACSPDKKTRMFRLKRKLERAQAYDRKYNSKHYGKNKTANVIKILDIEKLPYACEMQCILVEARSHLYQTTDYIVTHNTTILSQVALDAVQAGFNVALFSGELTDTRVKNWMHLQAAGRQYTMKLGNLDAYYVPSEYEAPIDKWLGDKMWLYLNNYGTEFKNLIGDIIEHIKKYQSDIIIIDNLTIIDTSQIDGFSTNDKQKYIIDSLHTMAQRYNVHVHFVCHPRKQMGFLRKEDICGTGDITNIADNVFMCHRVNRDFEKRAAEFYGVNEIKKILDAGHTNVIEIMKNRDLGKENLLIGFYFEVESKRLLSERFGNKYYGWQELMDKSSQEALANKWETVESLEEVF